MAQKRKCVFNSELEKEFPFIKRANTDNEVKCVKCLAQFSIANSGRAAITQHLNTTKHKKADFAASSSKPITKLFRPLTFDDQVKKLALREATWSYHCVQHNHSYRSNDCTSKLIKKCFDEQYSCTRTKTEAIVRNVFGQFIMDSIVADLSAVNFITIFSDCSNHGSVKMCAILARYFLPNKGVVVKVLNVKELPGENSDILTACLVECLEKYKAKNKLLALCADNTNSNFGGAQRRGQNNVFFKMQKTSAYKLIGVNCACHVVNNCMHTGVKYLPIDVEVIIIKIYSYFYIYTIRVEKLKEICNNIDVEYKKLLGYSKTRWLTLLPALDRILKLFEPLKAYFLQEEKCPTVLMNFFLNPLSELWLMFVQGEASNFHKHILKIESQDISMCEASLSLRELKANLIDRKEQGFLLFLVKKPITDLEHKAVDVTEFTTAIPKFYDTCITYLNRWDTAYEEVRIFEWVLLKRIPLWAEVEKCVLFILTRGSLEINDGDLFHEFNCLTKFLSPEKLEDWGKSTEIMNHHKWVEVIAHFKETEISYKNILKLVEFAFCLPGSNAPTERVFSIINNLWTTEKSQLRVETVEAFVLTKSNFNMSCCEFFDYIKDKTEFLQKITSCEKYQ